MPPWARCRPRGGKIARPPAPCPDHTASLLDTQMITPNFLMIQIVRKGETAEQDDVIVAKPMGGNILVKHTDGSRNKKVVTRTVLTHTSLSRYVATLAAMVRDDNDPFEYIQFNFPGFPMVMYTPARLHNPAVMRSLKDAAYATADSWFRHDPSYDADASSVSSDSSEETQPVEDYYWGGVNY